MSGGARGRRGGRGEGGRGGSAEQITYSNYRFSILTGFHGMVNETSDLGRF